jgi:hypothetical protein
MKVMAFLIVRVALVLCLFGCITSLQFGPFSFANKKPNQSKISDIIRKLEATNSGLITSSNPEIIASIDILRTAPFVEKRDSKLVDGFWELLWTTEKVPLIGTLHRLDLLSLLIQLLFLLQTRKHCSSRRMVYSERNVRGSARP